MSHDPSDIAALQGALQRAGTAKEAIEASEAQARADAARTATKLQRLQREVDELETARTPECDQPGQHPEHVILTTRQCPGVTEVDADPTDPEQSGLVSRVDLSRRVGGVDPSSGGVELENGGVGHRMVPGSHERPGGAECVCGGAWDRWMEQCVNQKGVTRRG